MRREARKEENMTFNARRIMVHIYWSSKSYARTNRAIHTKGDNESIHNDATSMENNVKTDQ
jgi:hypothetical protein